MKNLHFFLFSICLVLLFILFVPKNSYSIEHIINSGISESQEVPPVPETLAGGNIFGTYDDETHRLSFTVSFWELTSNATSAHLHGPAEREANAGIQINLLGFPASTQGSESFGEYILTLAQETQLLDGKWYINIHTGNFPNGEIRGQIDGGTLPVELSSFTSVVLNNTVTLNWSTAMEENNSGFDIERKLSGSESWAKAGNVKGNGNSSALNNYNFTENVNTGIYNYRLKQIDYNGNYEYYNLFGEVNVGTPDGFRLSQNYPNPFNPTTNIDFEIPNDANVSLTLFDISGKGVLSIMNEFKIAGYYTVQINVDNISSGIYFYKLSVTNVAGNFEQTKKMTVLK